MITIVLADDHNIVRQGLRVLLEAEPDLKLIGEARDGLEAINLVERRKPDVLIVDLSMPKLNGLDVTLRIHKSFPHTKVIILSMHANESYVLEALHNGASGYVLKEADSMELVRAVHEVMADHRYLSPPLTDLAIDVYTKKKELAKGHISVNITAREREILQLISESYTAKEVAKQLYISPRTVEHHISNMMNRFKLHNKSDLTGYAKRYGLLPTIPDSLNDKNEN